ncbi:MAG TPA: hypothetical protein DEB24_08540 [Coriobacteriia bacterium]|nr:hypothetical protein [Coriobacteriia bacterium]
MDKQAKLSKNKPEIDGARACAHTKKSRLRTALLHKLRSEAGDSLAEVIVALLIAALGAAALATLVLSATTVISKSEAEMEKIYAAELTIAAQQAGSDASITISGSGLASTPIVIPVQVQQDAGYDFKRYTVSGEVSP